MHRSDADDTVAVKVRVSVVYVEVPIDPNTSVPRATVPPQNAKLCRYVQPEQSWRVGDAIEVFQDFGNRYLMARWKAQCPSHFSSWPDEEVVLFQALCGLQES